MSGLFSSGLDDDDGSITLFEHHEVRATSECGGLPVQPEGVLAFDDTILGNSALGRSANASYQIVIEGTSYRERLSPHRALLGAKGGD